MIYKEKLARFAELHKTRKSLESALTDIKNDIAALEQDLMHEVFEQGVPSIKINDATIYLHTQLWASPAEGITKQQAALALQQDERTAPFVELGFNAHSISKFYRELAQQALSIDEIPRPAEIALTEKHSLRVRFSQ